MASDNTIVLIPGLNCTERLYESQIGALSDDFTVVVADQRHDDTVAGMARRLLADAPERFGLVGLSMGGYVALEVLRQAPGRVARLALLDTSARPDTAEGAANRLRLIELAETGRFEEVHDILWPRLVHPDRQADRVLEEVVKAMMRETGPEAFIRQQRAIMARPDSRDLLPSVEIPTLVLVGEQDVITPPDMAREMADRIEWASLVVLADCGHLSTLEQPDAVNHALRAWVAAERRG
ncbi:MAG TPA: alpha/beta fold hydrolase [Microvirga sp.]|jgi:pimeloyl-ACP methyl ester carboxylesterase